MLAAPPELSTWDAALFPVCAVNANLGNQVYDSSWYGVGCSAASGKAARLNLTGLDLSFNASSGNSVLNLVVQITSLTVRHGREGAHVRAQGADAGKEGGKGHLARRGPVAEGSCVRRRLHTLQELILRNASARGVLDDAIGALSDLKRLDLAVNHLTGAPKRHAPTMPPQQ